MRPLLFLALALMAGQPWLETVHAQAHAEEADDPHRHGYESDCTICAPVGHAQPVQRVSAAGQHSAIVGTPVLFHAAPASQQAWALPPARAPPASS